MADGRLYFLPELRDRTRVFLDRAHAGAVLAGMLGELRGTDALVLAVPAGGVPVAAELARRLDLPLDVAVVSKITLPWNTEAGYGAVAFDGTIRINEPLVARAGLSAREVEAGIEETLAKVRRRVRALRGERPPPRLAARLAVLVDDGLASGFTMATAVAALRRAGAGRLYVAVPTAHEEAVGRIAQGVDAVYVANLRSGPVFAVADAYRHWRDVSEDEARRILQTAQEAVGGEPRDR